MLSVAKDQNLCVWLLWSMKEAAYKAHQRKFSLPRRLNFHAQNCELKEFDSNSALGTVTIASETYDTFSKINAGMVHTIAVDKGASKVSVLLQEISSEEIKSLLRREISKTSGLPLERVNIKKNNEGIPYFSAPLLRQLPFSLSAHGRYAAYCFLNLPLNLQRYPSFQ